MSTLTVLESAKLERLFQMGGGYVLDFSHQSLELFVAETSGLNIHDAKYLAGSGSKAKILKEFWRKESDYVVGTLIKSLIQHVEDSITPWSSIPDSQKALIEPCKKIAERLISGKLNLEDLKTRADHFDARHLHEQIRRIEVSVETDPALAIGTAKELIETCCKTILEERGKSVKGTPDIPTLTKETLKELKLVPEGVPEATRGGDVVKRILQNLGAIGNGLAELRGLYGTGHGKHGKTSGLSARHAKLAVGAAATLVTFLFDTHKETHETH